MKHVPRIAFYAAVAILLAGSLAYKLASPDRSRAALSLSVDSGHIDFKAELGAALLALKF